MSKIFSEDIENISNSHIFKDSRIKNSKIFITGATGLVGSVLVRALLKTDCKLILLVRNIENAKKLFGENSNISFIEASVENYMPREMDIDYIIHLACPTKSKFLFENPVETIEISLNGTNNILRQAKMSGVKSFLYVSSMEMYGVLNDKCVTEEKLGFVSLSSPRSSYPESKRMCELLCYSYYSEYGVPAKTVRLAQTFGPGISLKENRVFKMFCDCVINQEDIVLKTQGTTVINYCYTTDAVKSIMIALLNGKDGEAYNACSDSEPMTIRECAEYLAKHYADGKISVKFDIAPGSFAPDNNMILNNSKIKEIGFKPEYTVLEGYDRLIKYLREEYNDREKN